MRFVTENERLVLKDKEDRPVITYVNCGMNLFESGRIFPLLYDHWTDNGNGVFSVRGQTTVSSCPEGSGVKFYTELTCGADSGRCDEFVVMRGTFAERIVRFLAPFVRDSNGSRTNEMLTSVESLPLFPDSEYEFGDFAVLETESGRKYLLGVVTFREYFSGIKVKGDGTVEVRAYTEQAPVAAGQTLKSDLFIFTEIDDPVTALLDYSDLCVRETIGSPRRKFDVPYGFCTWYYYLSDISEQTVTNSVDDLVALGGKLPAKYVQIDDGWQVFYGQWEENEKFPGGMKKCADEIKAAGYLPGLWFAPLWANKARIRQEHPEYFAMTRDGERTICLDLSVPEARDFLSGVMKKATYEWGFKYLKLDLMTTTLGAYKYADPSFNSLKNYRKCLEVINEAVPDDTFILGCTAPFGPSIGLVDGIRVSPDIGDDWTSLKVVFNCVLKRYHYHKKFFINDADCLIVRKAENKDDECRRNCTRTDDEILCYLSAAAASGGILMLSDKLRLMSAEQIEQISYLYPINTEAALPLDIMDSYVPGVLDCGKRGAIRTAMLINWEDTEKPLEIPLGEGRRRLFSFWDRKYLGVFEGSYCETLAPHTCRVLHITEDGAPAVIGCENEVIPVLDQKFENGKLTFTFIKPGDTVVIAAESVSGDAEIREISPGLFEASGEGTVTLTVK
ncbi:MAG: alpha-galactosidase [Clostridia bacterium]|nr:alpha-galactosidase [Clostridia bacterium]